jgi:hypothetical protein
VKEDEAEAETEAGAEAGAEAVKTARTMHSMQQLRD